MSRGGRIIKEAHRGIEGREMHVGGGCEDPKGSKRG